METKIMPDSVIWHLAVGNTVLEFHGKTLIMSWVVMAIMIIVCMMGVRSLTSGKPGPMQNLLEWTVDFIKNLIADNMDYKKGRLILPYLLTLIMFILFSNLIGLIPNFLGIISPMLPKFAQLNKIFSGPTLHSPTGDINCTAALAILTFCLIIFMGIRDKGIGYFKHFFDPHPVFFVIHVIDMLAKPLTLAFRLFGNIYAGKVLIMVILMLPGLWVLPGSIPLFIWLAFKAFIGFIQAFVFTILTTAYVAQAVADDH